MSQPAAADADAIRLKQRKGTWRRFIRLFPKCRLPWFWLVLYILFDVGTINIGLSETDLTAQLFSGDTSAGLVFRLIAVMVVNLVATNLSVFLGHVTSAKINRNMRGVVLDKVLKLPMSFFKEEEPREAVYRIVNNAIVIDSTIMLVILPLATAAYTAVSVFGRIFKYDWRLSVILLVFIPLQVFLAFLFGRINFSLSDREASLKASLTQRLAELVTNIPLAKAFVREDREARRGAELTQRLYKLSIKGSWLDQLQNLSDSAVSLIQTLIMILVAYTLLRNGEITKRAWVTFFLFSSVFNGAIDQFMMYYNNLKIIQGGADRVAEIMNAPEEDRSGEPCETLAGDLALSDVSFSYPSGKTVFSDLSCTFPDGQITALLGESGAGKTTLINLLLRLYPTEGGQITAGGADVSAFSLDSYRSRFVTISQNAMLFSGTIRENVCYGNGEVSDEALTGALRKAGILDFVQSLPEGVNAPVEEYGRNLSGGQRQRLALARALLSDAHYLLLDEPSAAMDAIAVRDLLRLLQDAARGKCLILIAHTPAVLDAATHLVVLEDGSAREGSFEELLPQSAFLRALSGKEATA